MCTAIGVDPLASSNNSGGGAGAGESVWAQLLGRTVNDFYFELAVRVVEVCGRTRGENGGLIGVEEVKELVSRGRMEGASAISEDDVRRAVETLRPLGGSYAIVKVGRKEYIRSVPRELSGDQESVVEAAQVLGPDVVLDAFLRILCSSSCCSGGHETWTPVLLLASGLRVNPEHTLSHQIVNHGPCSRRLPT